MTRAIARATAVSPPAPLPSTEELQRRLELVIDPRRVLCRHIDRIAFASDASFYRLIPRAVVLARSLDEIRALFALSRHVRVPLTFRAAGTSLSGQSITEGILVEVGRYWKTLRVEEGGRQVRVGPGVIGAHVNAALRGAKAKIGPDPASIATCMMGGILSNNASGMCCGVAQNAYHTLRSLTFVLPSGTTIDTSDPGADDQLRREEPQLHAGLLELKGEIERMPELKERIRRKYLTKNTTGYSLNAFVDFERPVDIFAHLLVGAEGTLAFIAEAVLGTVPDLPVKYTGLLLFPSLHAACAAIVPLRESGAKALELMDRASLRSVENEDGVPESIRALPDGAAALLVEYQCESETEREALTGTAQAAAAGLDLLAPALWTTDAAQQAQLWKIRSGMLPSVGALRRSGTTVIIEDVAFPIERLADAAVDLTALFARHGYDDGIIFGHAKDGNLHFVVTQGFNEATAVQRYERFMAEVVKLVVEKYDGALKAEHGTGRNMAPFVETEWGGAALEIMKRLKQLCDPEGVLNPGVILNDDPRAHVTDLKSIPTVEEEVDRCMECGFCEPKCPSRELTLTPRQRIVVRREMARLAERRANPELQHALDAAFPYDGLDTCAVDGLCATTCPVSINTGDLVKLFRQMRHTPAAQENARRVADRMVFVEPAARLGLRLGHAVAQTFGTGTMVGITRAMRTLSGKPLPLWSREMPRPALNVRPRTIRKSAHAVYFPSCISRVMGHLPGEPSELSMMQAFTEVAGRAGKPVYIPDGVAGTCCGVPWSSKGYGEGHKLAVDRAIARFWDWSDEGRLPIVIDTSPCTYGLRNCRACLSPENQARFDRLRILDSIEFFHDAVLPTLELRRKVRSVALHPVCSVVKMGLTPKLAALAQACSEHVLVPEQAGCCGFAGDRGFSFPEFTAAATLREAAEVTAEPHDAYLSSSRTCEIGMTRATGKIYRSFVYLLEQASR